MTGAKKKARDTRAPGGERQPWRGVYLTNGTGRGECAHRTRSLTPDDHALRCIAVREGASLRR